MGILAHCLLRCRLFPLLWGNSITLSKHLQRCMPCSPAVLFQVLVLERLFHVSAWKYVQGCTWHITGNNKTQTKCINELCSMWTGEYTDQYKYVNRSYMHVNMSGHGWLLILFLSVIYLLILCNFVSPVAKRESCMRWPQEPAI